jgi:hypothetical protein
MLDRMRVLAAFTLGPAVLIACKASSPSRMEQRIADETKSVTIGGKDWKNPVSASPDSIQEGAVHFPREVLGNLPLAGYASSQIAHNVGAAQGRHRVVQQPRVEMAQRLGAPEHHVGRPLALVGGQGVASLKGSEQGGVARVQLPGDFVQQARLVHSQLRPQQLLGSRPAFDPGKTVV